MKNKYFFGQNRPVFLKARPAAKVQKLEALAMKTVAEAREGDPGKMAERLREAVIKHAEDALAKVNLTEGLNAKTDELIDAAKTKMGKIYDDAIEAHPPGKDYTKVIAKVLGKIRGIARASRREYFAERRKISQRLKDKSKRLITKVDRLKDDDFEGATRLYEDIRGVLAKSARFRLMKRAKLIKAKKRVWEVMQIAVKKPAIDLMNVAQDFLEKTKQPLTQGQIERAKKLYRRHVTVGANLERGGVSKPEGFSDSKKNLMALIEKRQKLQKDLAMMSQSFQGSLIKLDVKRINGLLAGGKVDEARKIFVNIAKVNFEKHLGKNKGVLTIYGNKIPWKNNRIDLAKVANKLLDEEYSEIYEGWLKYEQRVLAHVDSKIAPIYDDYLKEFKSAKTGKMAKLEGKIQDKIKKIGKHQKDLGYGPGTYLAAWHDRFQRLSRRVAAAGKREKTRGKA